MYESFHLVHINRLRLNIKIEFIKNNKIKASCSIFYLDCKNLQKTG